MQWYYANGDEQDGPVPEHALEELARDGTIRRETLLWRSGMADWEPAWKHVESLEPQRPASAAGAPPIPGMPRAGSRRPGGGTDTEANRDYRRESGPVDAAREFFRRYTDFGGRSNRGEYWFWMLDSLVLGFLASAALGDTGNALWTLATIIPSIALGVRRLHDIGRSGWWLLIILVPLIGFLVLIYWAVQPPEDGPNQYG